MSAHTRRGDPATSHEAAAAVNRLANGVAVLEVMRLFGEPLSDHELVGYYARMRGSLMPGQAAKLPAQSESGIRSRRAELVAAGLVRRVDRDGVTPGGHRCDRYVWDAAHVPVADAESRWRAAAAARRSAPTSALSQLPRALRGPVRALANALGGGEEQIVRFVLSLGQRAGRTDRRARDDAQLTLEEV